MLLVVATISLAGALQWTECTLETPGIGRTKAKCASVTRDGVVVGFALLEPTGEKQEKRPDPIVMLPGGPGQAATETAAVVERALREARRDRDVILFDPRGTGRSGKLKCEEERSLKERLAAGTDFDAEKRKLAECARTLPLDPKRMTTNEIVRDLEVVREALGASTWNVLGISYGTRLALAYDRMFPGKTRSMVLDGLVPFSMILGERAGVDAERSLDMLENRTPAGAESERRAPLKEVARALREKLDGAPVDVAVAHPTTGEKLVVKLDGRTLVGIMRLMLYAEETAALVPLFLRAAERGDYEPIAAQVVGNDKLQDVIAQPMQLSVLCAEDGRWYTSTKRDDVDEGLGDFRQEIAEACSVWPASTEVPREWHDDLPASQTPALLFSGSADPVTPPSYAELARKTVPNSVHVVAAGLGHGVAIRGCADDVIADFYEHPVPSALDASCIAKLGPLPVFVDMMGPLP